MNELLRKKLEELDKIKLPVINSRMLRGGMQERIQRQEIKRYNNEMQSVKKRIKNRLNSNQNNRSKCFNVNSFGINSFGNTNSIKNISSIEKIESMEDFDIPMFRKIKNTNRHSR